MHAFYEQFLIHALQNWKVFFALPFQFYLPRPEIKSLDFFVACDSLFSSSLPSPLPQ